MHELNTPEIRRLGEPVGLMLEEDGNSSHENGEHLPGCGNRNSNGDALRFIKVTVNDDDRCDT
jgi:hypothetical protein